MNYCVVWQHLLIGPDAELIEATEVFGPMSEKQANQLADKLAELGETSFSHSCPLQERDE